jgi:hypothetical protein
MKGIPVKQLAVDTKVGPKGDRVEALRRRPGDMTQWAGKVNFVVGMNNPAIVTLEPPELRCIGVIEEQLYGHEVREKLGIGDEKLQIQRTKGKYHLGDTKGAQVSILPLPTHRAYEAYMGMKIDVCRWRMNILMDGLSAFEELAWVYGYPGTRIIRVGDVNMRVDDVAVRCKAPDANPETGEYDMDNVTGLTNFMLANRPDVVSAHHRGARHIMGIYGVVLNNGFLRLGDEIRLL